MNGKENKESLRAVVIGMPDDEFIGYVSAMLQEYEIEKISCQDVYSAVVELAKTGWQDIFIVGRMERLAWEKGRFLQKAAEHNAACICLWPKGDVRETYNGADTVKIITEQGPFEETLKSLLGCGGESCVKDGKQFNANQFLTTKAELDALLRSS